MDFYPTDLTQLIKDTLGYKDATSAIPLPKSLTAKSRSAHHPHCPVNKRRPTSSHTNKPDQYCQPPNTAPSSLVDQGSPGSSYELGSAVFKVLTVIIQLVCNSCCIFMYRLFQVIRKTKSIICLLHHLPVLLEDQYMQKRM